MFNPAQTHQQLTPMAQTTDDYFVYFYYILKLDNSKHLL